MAQSKKDSFYVINYRDPQTGENLRLQAQAVSDSTLGLGFIKVSEFIFDSSGLVIKPAEDQLRKRLEFVKALHLSIHSILSIEETGNRTLKFKTDRSNLVSLSGHQPLK